MIINNHYDVTLTAPSAQFESQINSCGLNNLSGRFDVSVDQCKVANRIYQGKGAVCYNVMRNCTGCFSKLSDQKVQEISDFCGPFGTSGFYRNGARFTHAYASEN